MDDDAERCRSGRRGPAGNPSCSHRSSPFVPSDTRRPPVSYAGSRRRQCTVPGGSVSLSGSAGLDTRRDASKYPHSPICLLLRINPVDRPRCIRSLVRQQPLLFFTPLEALHDRRRQPKPLRGARTHSPSRHNRRSPLTVMRSRFRRLRSGRRAPLLADPAVVDEPRHRSHLLAIVDTEHTSRDLCLQERTHAQQSEEAEA